MRISDWSSDVCRRVYTIERHRPLLREAEVRLEQLGVRNVTARYGDGTEGWRPVAPFDRIIAAAAAPEVPPALADQLAEGGLLVVAVGMRREEDRKSTRLNSSHKCATRI